MSSHVKRLVLLRFIYSTETNLGGTFLRRDRRYLTAKSRYHTGVKRANSGLGLRVAYPECLGVRGQHTLESHEIAYAQNSHKKNVISTLKPENLQITDFLDLSGTKSTRVHVRSFKGEKRGKSFIFRVFEGGVKGFLYYHVSPGRPLISGMLRFRVTPTSDPASFNEGYDMTKPSGFYWQKNLPQMNMDLQDLALRDELVTPATIEEAKHLRHSHPPQHLLTYLEQPFLLKFESGSFLWVAHDGGFRYAQLRFLASDRRTSYRKHCTRGVPPYTGSAVARLELSTLPEHTGTFWVVVRILKILQPAECTILDYDGHIQRPEEGSYVSYRDESGDYKPIALNLARGKLENIGLRVLLPIEHDLRPGSDSFPVSTLDPDRIKASDALTLARGQAELRVILKDEKLFSIRLPIFPPGHPYRPFMDSRAFIYFHKPPGLPQIAGEIRIRLTPTGDPSSFNQGHDLKSHTGMRWHIPFHLTVSRAQYEPLLEKLLNDKLITPAMLSHFKKIMAGTAPIGTRATTLHSPWQQFRLDCSNNDAVLVIFHPNSVDRVRISGYHLHTSENGEERFTGMALVRFEQSPFPEDAGKPILVLRVLETTDPGVFRLPNTAGPERDPKNGPLVMKMIKSGPVVYKFYLNHRAHLATFVEDVL
ncbi:hypothetical protein BDZ94DRAFT_1310214 [Collybia nuda]|uniref:Uncharacterized protein n=1 Tax=Collybia nuda TaxID=64659 RepID=A0A9P5Y415_9AGAR|nr:hypothetical protein BDZ94DRAFT_1310214 [Collybia nuda]